MTPCGIAVDTSRCPEEGHARRNKPLAAPETLCVLLTTARARARLKGPRLQSFDGETLFVAKVGAHFRDIVAIREQFPFDLFFCDAALYVEHLVTARLFPTTKSRRRTPSRTRGPSDRAGDAREPSTVDGCLLVHQRAAANVRTRFEAGGFGSRADGGNFS